MNHISAPEAVGRIFVTKVSPDAEVYLFRHAQTEMNINEHLVGGRSNEARLTTLGVEQAKRLGKLLLEKNIIPTEIFASIAIRAIDTAVLALEQMRLDDPVIYLQ